MTEATKPTIGIFELASCKGCQQQILNADADLLNVLSQAEIVYWPAVSSAKCPQELDIAIVEGAVATPEHEDFIKALREASKKIIAIGACACGLSRAESFGEHKFKPLTDFIKVDHFVRCCPIDTKNFINVLQSAIGGRNTFVPTATLCGECKSNEKGCFFGRGEVCAGLLSICGCDAICTRLGRQCYACSGFSPHAVMETALENAKAIECPQDEFESFLDVCNVDAFLEKDMHGKKDNEAAFIASRFDGQNSQECMLCALEASETEEIAEEVADLREVLRLAARAQNYLTKLYLQDLRITKGYESITQIEEKCHDTLEEFFNVRHVFTTLLEMIGGRAVHPITPVVGGFSVTPTIEEIKTARAALECILDFEIKTVDRFAENWEETTLATNTHSLDRVMKNWDNLTDPARFAAAKAGLRPPQTDDRRECVAMAVEVVDCTQRAINILAKY